MLALHFILNISVSHPLDSMETKSIKSCVQHDKTDKQTINSPLPDPDESVRALRGRCCC